LADEGDRVRGRQPDDWGHGHRDEQDLDREGRDRENRDDQDRARAALDARLRNLTASATGAGQAIRVTVASSGAMTGLEVDDRALWIGGVELSAEILRTMRRAQSGLPDRVAAAIADTVGADTQAGRAVLESFTRRFPAEPSTPPAAPVMPAPPPFPSFGVRPSLPHQASGGERRTHGY
jgi:hypothetical protein